MPKVSFDCDDDSGNDKGDDSIPSNESEEVEDGDDGRDGNDNVTGIEDEDGDGDSDSGDESIPSEESERVGVGDDGGDEDEDEAEDEDSDNGDESTSSDESEGVGAGDNGGDENDSVAKGFEENAAECDVAEKGRGDDSDEDGDDERETATGKATKVAWIVVEGWEIDCRTADDDNVVDDEASAVDDGVELTESPASAICDAETQSNSEDSEADQCSNSEESDTCSKSGFSGSDTCNQSGTRTRGHSAGCERHGDNKDGIERRDLRLELKKDRCMRRQRRARCPFEHRLTRPMVGPVPLDEEGSLTPQLHSLIQEWQTA